jgi:actin-related protein
LANNKAQPIVIDIGTALSKIGFAGEDTPNLVIPTIPTNPIALGSSIIRPLQEKSDLKPLSITDKTRFLSNPLLERGIIKDWPLLEKFLHNVFYNMLRVDSKNHPLLLSEDPMNPVEDRNKMAKIMFEKFNIPKLLIMMQQSLSILAAGRVTGCIVDIGEGSTKIIPISEGYVLTHAIHVMDLAGQDITRYLLRLLREAGYSLNSPPEKNLAIDIKEMYCYISGDFNEEINAMKMDSSMEKIYKKPDGEEIKVKGERFKAPECLFRPVLVGKELNPLHEYIIEAISSCDRNLQAELYRNIILSGGSSKFPGLKDRLKFEISRLVPNSIEVNVITPPKRELMTWIGGSLLTSLPSFSDIAITRQKYDGNGGVY